MDRIKQLWFPIAILLIIVVTAGWILALVINPNNTLNNEQFSIPTDAPSLNTEPTQVPSSTQSPTMTPTTVETNSPTQSATEIIPTFTSEPSDTLNCTFTIHYWRVYTDAWGIDSFDLDDRSYSKEQAIAIISIEDPSLVTTRLLQQYFIALLNIMKGADSSVIDITLETVNEWLIQHPPEAGLTQAESLEGESFADALQDYNEGVTGPGRCIDEPLTPTPGATPTPLNYTPPPTATNTLAPPGTIIFPTPTPTKKPDDGNNKPKPTSPPPTSEPTQPPPDTPEPPPPTEPPQPTQPPPTPAPTQAPPTGQP